MFLLIFSSCRENDEDNVDGENFCYEIPDSSYDNFPYDGKANVVFRDEDGNELKMALTNTLLMHKLGNYLSPLFQYKFETHFFSLIGDIGGVEEVFMLRIDETPDGLDPSGKGHGTVLWVHLIEDVMIYNQFFYIIANNGLPEENFLINEIITEPTLMLGERVFNDVMYHDNFDDEKSRNIYYNEEFGILQFIDRFNQKWTFDRFE